MIKKQLRELIRIADVIFHEIAHMWFEIYYDEMVEWNMA